MKPRSRTRSTGTTNKTTRKPAAKKTTVKKKNTWMDRGKRGIAKSEEERDAVAAKREEMKNQPYAPQRFWINNNEEANIIILDNSVDDIVFAHEHHFVDESKTHQDVLCVGEFDDCPICDGEIEMTGKYDKREPYYAMFLSIIDTRGYTSKKTKAHVPFTRKLLMVKGAQHEKFIELLDAAQEEYGSIRGVVLKLHRNNDTNAPRTGEPKIVNKGKMYARYSEKTIQTRYAHDPVLNKDDEVVVEANEFQKVFDYSTIFPKPDADEIRRKFGLETSEGSMNNEYDEDVDEETEDDLPFEEEEESSSMNDEYDEDEPEDNENDDDFDD